MMRLRRPTAAAAVVLLAVLLPLLLTACLHNDGDESSREAALTATGPEGETAQEEATSEVPPVFPGSSSDLPEKPLAGPLVARPAASPEPAFPAASAEQVAEQEQGQRPVLKPMDEAAWKKLSDKAKNNKDETIPVIIALKVDSQPEGRLRKEERDAQRKNIADKRNAVLQALKGKKYKKVTGFDEVPVVLAHVSPEALDTLRRSPDVAAVSEDQLNELDPPHPQGTSSNESNADWWDFWRIDVDDARAQGYDGRNQTVAIVDTGVERNHTWLSGKVVSEACYSTFREGSSAGGCPNGTWTQAGVGAAAPCNFHGDCGHGTHVAQTAAGHYSGVAKSANIVGIQVFQPNPTPGGRPTYSDGDLLRALKRVYDLRSWYSIAAVNFSLGGYRHYGYCDNVNTNMYYFYQWVAALRSVGIATVISSGNNDYPDSTGRPGCISNAISVGNTTLSGGQDAVYGNTKYGSNAATFLSILAPGTHVCSALPGNRWDCWTGTSMAAPQVTGAIATLKQLAVQLGRVPSVTSFLNSLRASGTPVTDSRNNIVKRRLNVWQALIHYNNNP